MTRIRLDGSIVWSKAYGSMAEEAPVVGGGVVVDGEQVVMGGWSKGVGGGSHQRLWAIAVAITDGSVRWSTVVGAGESFPMAPAHLGPALG